MCSSLPSSQAFEHSSLSLSHPSPTHPSTHPPVDAENCTFIGYLILLHRSGILRFSPTALHHARKHPSTQWPHEKTAREHTDTLNTQTLREGTEQFCHGHSLERTLACSESALIDAMSEPPSEAVVAASYFSERETLPKRVSKSLS